MSAKKRTSPKPPALKARRAGPPRSVRTPRKPPVPRPGSFPIVGIGASAGGLEAFTQLLGALPVDTGLALVLVQHLAPQHESMLTALLSHATKLPVHEARDGMRVAPNHIYVIPPNTNLAVLHGRLSLMPRTEARGRHLPVDFFFRSLAADMKERSIGVILSGTASDGTEGLRVIKAEGGLTFSQDEKSAKYDGMPHSAIAAGVVDFVLPPEGIARELARLGRHPYIAQPAAKAEDPLPESDGELSKVFILLRSATGVDFSFYKPPTLRRRIARRMALHKIGSLAHYVRFLRQTPHEVDALYQDLLINVTSFFREPEAFEVLKRRVFPRLLKDRQAQTPIRVWVPGCSTGEEAYSIAIALLECLGHKGAGVPVQVFATDVSERAIDKARAGIYPAGIGADVSPARLRRFFAGHDGGFQISKAVRDVCVFARQDVTKDPPFSRLDVISCRNLLIYLGPVLQKRVIPTFHYALKQGGVLLLGGSETIGGFADLFTLADSRHKLYTRKPAAHRLEIAAPLQSDLDAAAEPGHPAAPAPTAGFDYQKEADRILLGKYTPSGVVVNEDLERTNEELQSANEEILSSNEELQSTNEELETAKEELQSTNEELQTVNDELHTRNGELGQVNNDLVNLLNSVQIPIVILDGDLRIRRFTPLAERVLNLIPTDVGRPLSDLRPNIIVPEFERLIAEVTDTLAPKEVEVQDRDGRWHSLRIRPYKTLENKIDGVILALVDIDTMRRSLAEAREAREFADAIVETVRHPLLVLDGELRVKTANRAFYQLFRMRPEETENRFIYNLGKAQWDIAKLRELLEGILPKSSRFEDFEVDAEFPGAGRKKLVLNARRIADEGLKTKSILLAMEEAKTP